MSDRALILGLALTFLLPSDAAAQGEDDLDQVSSVLSPSVAERAG